MSSITIQDRPIGRKRLTHRAAKDLTNAPGSRLRGVTTGSSNILRGYLPEAAEDDYFEMARRQGPRIALKAKGTILLFSLFDIVALQAEGNYVSLQHRSHRYLVHESLSSMAEKLKPYGFIRIHRSVVINVAAVEEIKPLTSGEYRLRARAGSEYLVTRTYKRNLRDLAQLWVGAERPRG